MKSNLFFLTALAGLTVGNISASAQDKPNVLFIAVDDLKPILGCYGDELVKSPNIDRLAAQGTVFLNAHCQQAVCGPSRASLLTGLRPDTTKVWDLKTRIRDILPDVVTLPQYFKENGYTAVGTGKIYDPRSVDSRNADDPASWSRPYVQFGDNPDEEFGCVNPEFVAKVRALKEKGVVKDGALKKKLGGTPPVEIDQDVPDNAYADGRIADTGIALLNELAPKDEPFFIAVGFKKPHLPFVAPKKYADLYKRSQFHLAEVKERPEGAPDFHWQPGWELRNGSYSDIPPIGDGGPIPEDMQITLIHGYYACVSYTDAQIGRLLDALEESGEADNTIVVLWGDHGWHLGDHGMWCKHTNYEQATRVPLIIADLRKPTGQQSTSVAEFVDVYPTLCELSGLPVPEVLEGDSLVRVLDDPSALVKDAAVSQFPRHVSGHGEIMGYAWRDSRYRYIEWVDGDFYAGEPSGEVIAREFYDYKADPQERRNLIDNPEYVREINRLQTIAAAYKQKKDQVEANPKPAPVKKQAKQPVESCNNLLLNPGFASGALAPWKLQDQKAPATAVIEAGGTLKLEINEAGKQPYHRTLQQPDLKLDSDTKYLLQFDMRTDADNGGDIKVSVVHSIDYKAPHYGLMRSETPGAEWTTLQYSFKTKEIDPNDPACLKIHLGELNGNTTFKNFILEKVK